MKPLHVIVSREFKGLMDRLHERIEYARHIRGFASEIAGIFSGKRVAIVGNSPGLIGKGLGAEIDAHDLVVRLNGGIRLPAPDDLGKKMHVMFLGATMEKEKDFLELNKNSANCIAISTAKNRQILGAMAFSQAVFYPRVLPRVMTRTLQRLLQVENRERKFRPPRSGLICLAAVHAYGNASQISLYGMSDSLEKSGNRVTPTGEVTQYDPHQYKSLHCDPAIELALLKGLTAQAPHIDWRGRD